MSKKKYYYYVKKGRSSQVGEHNSNYKPLIERFFSKVDKNVGLCWLWTGALDSWGYGNIRIEGKNQKASRVSYRMHKGDIPAGKLVLHTCDRPACVNPDHLWLGTNTDNMQDMVKKGRNSCKSGENNKNSRLSKEDVEEIRKMYTTGLYTKEKLGILFSISGTHAGRIILGKAWAN